MILFTSPEELQQQCIEWKKEGLSIGLVPTMGYFHAGHESLMHAARAETDRLIVSLFVNPTQFGQGEDLDAYPRDMMKDLATGRKIGVDAFFMPEVATMYPKEFGTDVGIVSMEKLLCGQSRPTHFRGVCTVVLKLLMLAQPSTAFFGQKDWQQLCLIKRMVTDLCVPVTITGVPIVRELDGLALSSRNAYLSPAERAEAPFLQKGLLVAAALLGKGETDSAVLLEAVSRFWGDHLPLGTVDYLTAVDPDTLLPVSQIANPTILAAAVKIGKARLIDNICLQPA